MLIFIYDVVLIFLLSLSIILIIFFFFCFSTMSDIEKQLRILKELKGDLKKLISTDIENIDANDEFFKEVADKFINLWNNDVIYTKNDMEQKKVDIETFKKVIIDLKSKMHPSLKLEDSKSKVIE